MVLVLAFVRNLDKVANYKYTLMIVGFLLLLSPLVPGLGQEIYGSRIWLSLGGFSFQPGEIAKIIIVLFLAGYLAQNREMLSVFTVRVGPFRLPDIRTLLPLILMWGVALLIVVFEKDLGSALSFVLHVPRHAVRGHRQEVLSGHRIGPHRRGRRGRVSGVRPRASAREHLARPVRRRAEHRLPTHPGHLLHCRRRPVRRGAGQRWPSRSPSWRATSSSPTSPKRSAFWAQPACCFCSCVSPSAGS